MILYDMLRGVNKKLKAEKKRRMGRHISAVRRIERVAPPRGERLVAMTFDDGPMALPPSPDVAGGAALSRHLVDTLAEFGFTATFDIVGDTSENYPDTRGKADSFTWGGVRFDHYPNMDEDKKGGAANCPELVRHMTNKGMELANHSYRHRLFGPKRLVYGSRAYFPGLDEVLDDLGRLHATAAALGHTMRLARPPHYVDGIRGGFTSYDAYELMGYNYMAASFDGGGWMPSPGAYDAEVEKMVAAVRRALERDPESLNGQIIFQKDGYNMSVMTPIASALQPQLELLAAHGYRVVSVSELLARSPFEDLDPDDEAADAARGLLEAGHAVAYRNNTFRADAELNFGDACMMVAPVEERSFRLLLRKQGGEAPGRLPLSHPYATAVHWAARGGLRLALGEPVARETLARLLEHAGIEPKLEGDGLYTRREAVIDIWRSVGPQANG